MFIRSLAPKILHAQGDLERLAVGSPICLCDRHFSLEDVGHELAGKELTMKFDTLERMPNGEAERVTYIARQSGLVMRREAENADGRPKLALDWIERPYQSDSGNLVSVIARKISSRIGIDAETAFRILLCAKEVARKWHTKSDNRFRLLDLAFDVSRLLCTGFNTVHAVLAETVAIRMQD